MSWAWVRALAIICHSCSMRASKRDEKRESVCIRAHAHSRTQRGVTSVRRNYLWLFKHAQRHRASCKPPILFWGLPHFVWLKWNARLWKWTRTECVSCTIICSKFNFFFSLERELWNAVDIVVAVVVTDAVAVYQYLDHFVGVRVILHNFRCSISISLDNLCFWKFNWYDCVRIIY